MTDPNDASTAKSDAQGAAEPRDDAGNARAAPKGGLDRHKRLGRRTALISGLTLVSRILGFVREMIASALFGTSSGIFDAFITAWRVPNLFRRFLGEGALSTSFQTSLTAVDGNHGDAAGRVLFAGTMRMLLGILVGLCMVLMGLVALAPDQMPGTDWHWLGEDPGAVRELTLRLMPFVILVCLSAIVTGALHVRGRFGAPAIAPAAMNLVWIIALLGVAMHFGWYNPDVAEGVDPVAAAELRQMSMARWLAGGVLIAGVVQLAVQWPALRKAGLLGGRGESPVKLPADVPTPFQILRRSAPLALGAAVYQINVMIDGLMAEGLLPNGGPTTHYLANRVQQFPLALVAIAATSAVFPALQALGHRRQLREMRALHDRTHLAIAGLAIPAALSLFVLAEPVIDVLFRRANSTEEGVLRTALALKVLCIAIVPAGATGLIARTYYSMGNLATPMKVSAAMLVLNVGLNAWFLVGLGMDVEGLAAATAITSALNAAVLLAGLTRILGLPKGVQPVLATLAKITLASIVAAALAGVTEAAADDHLRRSLALGLAMCVGGVTYAALAHALNVDIVRRLVQRFTGRP